MNVETLVGIQKVDFYFYLNKLMNIYYFMNIFLMLSIQVETVPFLNQIIIILR